VTAPGPAIIGLGTNILLFTQAAAHVCRQCAWIVQIPYLKVSAQSAWRAISWDFEGVGWAKDRISRATTVGLRSATTTGSLSQSPHTRCKVRKPTPKRVQPASATTPPTSVARNSQHSSLPELEEPLSPSLSHIRHHTHKNALPVIPVPMMGRDKGVIFATTPCSRSICSSAAIENRVIVFVAARRLRRSAGTECCVRLPGESAGYSRARSDVDFHGDLPLEPIRGASMPAQKTKKKRG